MGRYLSCLVTAWIVVFPLPSLAQSFPSTYLVEVLGSVSPTSPSVTVRISASWEPHPNYLWFDNGRFDFESGESGVFTDSRLLPVYTRGILAPGARPGVISDNRVVDVFVHQFFMPHVSLFPLPDNPLAVWEVTWTTQDFTPRWVPIRTAGVQWLTLFGDSPPYPKYQPSSAFIRVVPAPATIAFMLGGLMFAARRRR